MKLHILVVSTDDNSISVGAFSTEALAQAAYVKMIVDGPLGEDYEGPFEYEHLSGYFGEMLYPEIKEVEVDADPVWACDL